MEFIGFLEEYRHKVRCISDSVYSLQDCIRNSGGVVYHVLVSIPPADARGYLMIPLASVLSTVTITSADTVATMMVKMATVPLATWSGVAVTRPMPRLIQTTKSGSMVPLPYVTNGSVAPRIISLEHNQFYNARFGSYKNGVGSITLDRNGYVPAITRDLVILDNEDHPLLLDGAFVSIHGVFLPTVYATDRLWVLGAASVIENTPETGRGVVVMDFSPLGTVTRHDKSTWTTSGAGSTPGCITLPEGVDLTTGYVMLIFHGKLYFKDELHITNQRVVTFKNSTTVGIPFLHTKHTLTPQSLRNPLWYANVGTVASLKTYMQTVPTSAWLGENCIIHITGRKVYVNEVQSTMTLGEDKAVFPPRTEGILLNTMTGAVVDYTKQLWESSMVATFSPQRNMQVVDLRNPNATNVSLSEYRTRATSYSGIANPDKLGYRLIDIISTT